MVLIINIANNHIYESDGEKKSVFMADFFFLLSSLCKPHEGEISLHHHHT